MDEKKNIDRLFQEKFKDFEATPNESVWKKIQAQKDHKRKKSAMIPFWFRIAGAAALVALLFSISFLYINKSPKSDNFVTNPTNQKPNNNSFKKTNKDTPAVTDQYVDSTENNGLKDQNVSSDQKNSKQKQKTTITSSISIPKEQRRNNNPKETIVSRAENKVQITNTTNNFKHIDTKKSGSHLNVQKTKDTQEGFKKEILLPNSENNPVVVHDGVLTKNNKDLEIENEKKSIFDAITEKHEEEEQGEEASITKSSENKKWNIAPTIAPVYYNSLSNGSSIDSQFIDNAKQGQVNMSYGVQIAYAVNNKISIRSGVNSVTLGYGTKNIGFTASSSIQRLENIAPAKESEIISVGDYIPNARPQAFSNSEIRNTKSIEAPQNRGTLNQSISYLEIPVEMKYALINKKLGVHVIGGISTLVLQNSELTIEVGDFTTEISKADNLQDISFSSNIGIGFDYQISNQFLINMEPIFKYQINAYTKNSGDFKPYYFGVYTGISFKF